MALAHKFPEPADLIGKFRRFGPAGPVYEIVSVARTLEDGDTMMLVRLPETGEEAEYRCSRILNDLKET